ncbi:MULTISPECIES: ABC transporter ATP-binding protein [Bifidobacterium]|jgi:putative ABC transport system ATP-binding protein|uniref:ABC transporter ATP-binding protein n=1 Tax=Bifidobacterium TaxID=1678 RepID=UPI0026491DC7|nr:ABC transporter ATP-binding protein [Bifidobacterium crudilactis]MDN5973492.1 ABC transporter ATP-binding protein [Bifidobacterium crudilactis]MDN6001811.1 ABC transporter ATP-binding protein [Bifidobacterium crudilactis]MDN6553828.1 ABC transporter ATP-binding protein [Bifidobacterium mongoliense]
MASPLLAATGIRKTYHTKRDQIEVLRGVDLSVDPGEFVAVIGKSGSGKSTLLYSLCGLLKTDSGTISLCGQPITGQSNTQLARLRRNHVGFIFQDLNLISALNVADNIRLPAKMAAIHITPGQVDAVLHQVGLDHMGHEQPDNLSGGQRQRVAIARALLRRPDVLFADEPTGSLDPSTARSIMHLMRQTITPNNALIMVTHDLELAATADRVIVLADGISDTILSHPTIEQLFELTREEIA